jgi:coproporphyrinogen III oxidase
MTTQSNYNFTPHQLECSNWFKSLRNQICKEFELLEESLINNPLNLPKGQFERKTWKRAGGGGGEISMMKGRVFEKVGVNFSAVYGKFSEEFRKQIPGTEEDPNFFACGISLVAHMRSPLVPAVHFNTRFINTRKTWFGGGTDLTPIFKNQEDTNLFHKDLKEMCDRHNPTYYQKFSKQCDKYFFLPHRNEPRGIGGIFFDYMNNGNFDKDFEFVQDTGKTFLNTYIKIVRKNSESTWTDKQREAQLIKRGRYVEFNLLYDRGTKFGLMTGGNTEAILMSLPPVAKWS